MENAVPEPIQPKVTPKLPKQVIVSYVLMVVAVVMVVFALIFSLSGYKIEPTTGEIAKTGLVQVASSPTGASVTIDGKLHGSKTNMKLTLEEGEHHFEMNKSGFRTWQGNYKVVQSDILWLDYALLWPEELKMKEVDDFKMTPLFELDHNRVLASSAVDLSLSSAASADLFLVDFENEIKTRKVTWTMASLSAALAKIDPELKIKRIVGGNSDNYFWIVASVLDNASQGEVTKIFAWTAGSGVLTPVTSGKIVKNYAIYKNNLVFSSLSSDGKRAEIYFYREGDLQAAQWQTRDDLDLKLAFTNYDNSNYLAVVVNEKVELWQNGSGRFYENAELVTELPSAGNKALAFSPYGRFLSFGSSVLMNYDLEDKKLYETEISTEARWLNNFSFRQLTDGNCAVSVSEVAETKETDDAGGASDAKCLSVVDFDGQNRQEFEIAPEQIFLSRNNKKLYYFDKDKKLFNTDLTQ
ncbi:MAG: PEGA domain-containing protein [Candidatus Nomurabacteria bacterium]|jgi:hypothetical protein|nr:PEGA domain-containing protein [Candidatus Nomurabacteria bacterium]